MVVVVAEEEEEKVEVAVVKEEEDQQGFQRPQLCSCDSGDKVEDRPQQVIKADFLHRCLHYCVVLLLALLHGASHHPHVMK